MAHSLARTRVSPFARVVRSLNEYQRAAGWVTPVAGPFEHVSAGSFRVRSSQARFVLHRPSLGNIPAKCCKNSASARLTWRSSDSREW